MTTIEEYKAAIKAATTKEELDKISYTAFIQDNKPIVLPPDNLTPRPKTFAERVDRLIYKREHELGLLEDDAYIPTDDNGNYMDRALLAKMKNDFWAQMKDIFA